MNSAAHMTAKQQRQRAHITRTLKRDIAKNGIEPFLNRLFGQGQWQYDAREQLWIAPDQNYSGPGRQYFCVKANGDWFKAHLNEGVTQ